MLSQSDLPDSVDQTGLLLLKERFGVSSAAIHPLSYNQQVMWFLQKLDPGTTVYNTGFAVHMETEIDVALAKEALRQVVDRHDVLHTVYSQHGGRPVQVVLPQLDVAIEVINALDWSAEEVKREVDGFFNLPFDLENEQVLRSRWYQVGDSIVIWQIVMHHIAVDGWSIWLLADELRRNVVALVKDSLPDDKPVRTSYVDFVQWQRDLLTSVRGQQMADYWRNELAGTLPSLDLPRKISRTRDKTRSYASFLFTIKAPVAQKVHELSLGNGTSAYTLLLAVFQLFLAKYSGQEDVLVGSPVHGRGSRHFAAVVGYFVNLTVLRGTVNPDISFLDFLQQTDEKVRAALLHQHYPFALVANQARPDSDDPARGFIQAMFNLIRPPRKVLDLLSVWTDGSKEQDIELDRLNIKSLDVETGYGFNGIELYLEVIDFQDRLQAKLGYDQALFTADTIRQMVDHFCQLLENALQNFDQPLGQLLKIIPAGEKMDHPILPKPDTSLDKAREQEPYQGPRTAHQQLVAEVWAEVLQIDRVGTNDNFFELGGHSLLATQVMSRIEEAIGITLPLRAVFESPTVPGLAAALDQASPNQVIKPPPVTAAERKGDIPLSFAQERMWFLYQMAPDDYAHHIPVTLRYGSAINLEALQKALDELVVRHESMRTIFPTIDGVPRQEILPPFAVEVKAIDLSQTPQSKQEDALRQLVLSVYQMPFDPTTAPPWRFTLLCLNKELFILSFTFHHIIFDAWSTAILWQDFHTLYHAADLGEKARLPALRVQYADFSVWQRKWLQGQALQNLLAYWQKQLANLPLLSLPEDIQRAPVLTFDGATESLPISADLVETLQRASQQAGVSLFMLMLAAFKVLLARYSGQTDFAVGVPVANRQQLALEPIIGTFVNTLVVRSDLSGDPTFSQLLASVRDTLLDAYAHQDLPFERVVSELARERDFSRTPLVQVLFNMDNTPFDQRQAAQSPVSIVTIDRSAAAFELSVTVVVDPNLPIDPQIILEYNNKLFEPETIRRFLAHYRLLLQAVAADSSKSIWQYDLLDAMERMQILTAWNQTQAFYEQQSLHALFVKQARLTPGKTAVSFGNRSLTYQELDQQSNQLARYLRGLGVQRETVVGLLIERSLDMVVALLGILKADGAFLPLDPAFPANRLAYMLEDTQVKLILTESTLQDQLPADSIIQPVALDKVKSHIDQLPAVSLPESAGPENLAYVIYTSGSSGKPKGIEIEHGSVVNFILSMKRQPGLNPEDVLLAVTTLSFDISVLEIFLPLVTGAQVVVADARTAADGRELIKAINKFSATVLQATPTTWSMLVDAGWQDTPTLAKALSGGEALPLTLAQAILEHDLELWNMYGPTETTIWSSIQRIMPGQDRITIGRPIDNTMFYVLDHSGQPVPIGVLGELYIGGAGVARGYRNQDELTNQYFLPDPFTGWSHNGRMYRSGDMVRYLPDGTLDYYGRKDFQVKIRGHRIEIGEVEAALAAHPEVRKAVVADYQGLIDQMLVAYIVAQDEVEKPGIGDLRDFLRTSLPDYMIPTAFIYLEELPLTSNRKIDRKKLPSPEGIRPELQKPFVAPRNALETVLADILADLLELEEVGVHDNFFELGGHSLLATRYVARVSKALRMELPLWTFLRAPTVADLATDLQSQPEGPRIERVAELRLKMASLSAEEFQEQRKRLSSAAGSGQ